MKRGIIDYRTFLDSKKEITSSHLQQESEKIINHFKPAKQMISHFAPITYLLDYTTGKYIYMEDSCFDVLGLKANYFLETGLDEYLSRWHPDDFHIINTSVFPENLRFLKTFPAEKFQDYIFSFNYRVTNVEGQYVILLQRFSYIPDKTTSEPLGVIGVAFDITHFKNDTSVVHTIEKAIPCHDIVVNELVYKKVYPVSEQIRLDKLSKKEEAILQLIAKGMSSKQIASQLGISIYTVNNHRKNMLFKTGCNSVSELINQAVKHGLL